MAVATLEETVHAILALVVGDKLPDRKSVVAKLALPPDPLTLDLAIYGQAVNDAKKALAASKVPVVVKSLDSPLTELFIEGSLDKTMYRYDKKLMELIKKSPGYTPPQERIIQKLVTALAQCEHQEVLKTSHAKALTVRQFLASDAPGQIATINAIWNECTVPGVYDTKATLMFEPDNDVTLGGVSQLPSSVHPNRSGGAVVTTFKRGRAGTPFKTLGVGFRVEGSFDRKKGEDAKKLTSSIERVLKNGMVPQVTIEWLMLDNGKDIAGTEVGGAALAPRLNIAQRDLWNESGVCVARSFFGASAFPLRDHEGQALLWAVNVTDLVGYDTEQWQVTQGKGAAWRSGEKCFAKVPPGDILGYIVIDKLGDGGSGWKFSVPKGAKWQSVGFPTMAQGAYMEQELAAWAGVTATVNTQYDFQQPPVK